MITFESDDPLPRPLSVETSLSRSTSSLLPALEMSSPFLPRSSGREIDMTRALYTRRGEEAINSAGFDLQNVLLILRIIHAPLLKTKTH